MNCSVIDCGEPATILVRAEMWTDGGLTLSVAWEGWQALTGDDSPAAASLFCEPHAREHLAQLPLLAPVDGARAADGEVYTHG